MLACRAHELVSVSSSPFSHVSTRLQTLRCLHTRQNYARSSSWSRAQCYSQLVRISDARSQPSDFGAFEGTVSKLPLPRNHQTFRRSWLSSQNPYLGSLPVIVEIIVILHIWHTTGRNTSSRANDGMPAAEPIVAMLTFSYAISFTKHRVTSLRAHGLHQKEWRPTKQEKGPYGRAFITAENVRWLRILQASHSLSSTHEHNLDATIRHERLTSMATAKGLGVKK